MNKLVSRIERLFWYALSKIIRLCVPIKNNRIIIWAYSYRKYTCHPQHFTEYLLDKHPNDFEIVWAFNKPENFLLDPRIKVVKHPSFQYLWYLYSSKFIISNSRCKKYLNFFERRNKQEYIQTWHDSGIALKQIEKDAASTLGKYAQEAQIDSENCTLMLSGSKFQTNLIRSSFWYKGDILEKGLPRNDCFANEDKSLIVEKVKKNYGVDNQRRILLYAPTFRNEGTENEVFINQWGDIIETLGDIEILVRLHPNSIGKVDMHRLLSHPYIKNATAYNDMQELIIASDYLITDYSSCMIDMAILSKPCFLYTVDIDSYDRGYYFDLRSLPFPVATSMNELIHNINNFNYELYRTKLLKFLKEETGLYKVGISCESLYSWMLRKK